VQRGDVLCLLLSCKRCSILRGDGSEHQLLHHDDFGFANMPDYATALHEIRPFVWEQFIIR
jgi:hypothetical protein